MERVSDINIAGEVGEGGVGGVLWGGWGIPHLENILRLRVRRRGHDFESVPVRLV